MFLRMMDDRVFAVALLSLKRFLAVRPGFPLCSARGIVSRHSSAAPTFGSPLPIKTARKGLGQSSSVCQSAFT